MLAIIGSHPSIVCLSLYNEDWGAEDIANNVETRNYIARTRDFINLNYSQLLVVDNDGWHHVSSEGSLQSDLLTVHLYTPDLSRWQELLDKLVQGQDEGVAAHPLVVGDPFFYRGQIPFVVSEWGGFGFDMYGGPEVLTAREQRIRSYKDELHTRPIAGDVYTQAVSIEEEDNGLIDAESGKLLVSEGLLHTSQ
jgi:hypothetical protein